MTTLIVGNGSDIDKSHIENLNIDYVICADGGLEKVKRLGLIPNLILGDFDSVNKSVLEDYKSLNIETVTFPSEKDYTDMELAISHAVKVGFKDIILVGASGTRLDHTVANMLLIEKYHKKDINIRIIDNNNFIQIITDSMIIPFRKNYYVSLIPLSENIEGLTLEGFKYPLNNINVERGSTLCISNEVSEDVGLIKLNKGSAFVFISKD
ncbi:MULTISPECIES: thiamine diphosphokinase [Sedimentibacter]|uniref:Thiamine diphosphokinase n=1 Tax=Sedimentibacter hydroxybenzoicus DSM 7310 TaxID=1123245 RepID=A0A974BJQ6_SEDHY|nr:MULTISPECIES: thiamine diphosphokinase [Sedimentibacter]NYB74449.1 thiamine diphosphokinase [Sedimentibacter hydroxybenzoicus DSM 7310]